MYLLEAATGTSAFDFTTLDLGALVPTFMGAVSATIGISITLVAIKKGISWLFHSIRSA